MCGRYTFTQVEGVAQRFQLNSLDVCLLPGYNIAPSQNAPVVVNQGDTRLKLFRWGLIPYWAKDMGIGNKMINARAETIKDKPSFKLSLQRKRCLVIADGFYEWKRAGTQKQPFRITLKDEKVFAFAGLWDSWASPTGEKVNSFTIITTEPNDLMKPLHSRMPVILDSESEAIWLDSSVTDMELLTTLLKPYPADAMLAYEVSPIVNSPKNYGAECIVPFGQAHIGINGFA